MLQDLEVNLSRFRNMLPKTLKEVSVILSPENIKYIPISSVTGKKAVAWPQKNKDQDGNPCGTLLQIGGCFDAVFTSNVTTIGHRDGYSTREAVSACLMKPNDDFEISIAKWAHKDTFDFWVYMPISIKREPNFKHPLDVRAKIGAFICHSLPDADIAFLTKKAFELYREKIPCKEFMHSFETICLEIGIEPMPGSFGAKFWQKKEELVYGETGLKI